MIPKGIEDRYEIVQILRETAATAVLLVNYKKIGALRILKAVHRAHPDAYSILSEAHLLQGIKSSQIPTIYSVEDSDEMYYLVEEFIEGLSLREYLLETKLSKNELFKIAISLCDVMQAIHNAEPEPVLYRDLKPEHVILQNEAIRLIDFGISVKKSEAAKARPLGTINWAAPEQLKGERLDERCDIFSLGRIIEFMQINSDAKDDYRLKRVVDQAIDENIDNRISSVKELKNKLLDLQDEKNNKKQGKEGLEKNIAVVGADHSVGTTHIAINMCRYLNKKGYEAYYKDLMGDSVHTLLKKLNGARIKEGVLYHKNFRGVLNYGSALEKMNPPNGLVITDCGTDVELAMDADLVVVVVNTSPWHEIALPEFIKNKSVYVVCNLATKMSCIRLAREIKKRVYMYPLAPSTNKLFGDEERIFSKILRNEKGF